MGSKASVTGREAAIPARKKAGSHGRSQRLEGRVRQDEDLRRQIARSRRNRRSGVQSTTPQVESAAFRICGEVEPTLLGVGDDRTCVILLPIPVSRSKMLAVGDPVVGLVEDFLGIGLEHQPLARPPAARVHPAWIARRELVLVIVRVEFRPQIDVALGALQRAEEFRARLPDRDCR